jgi:hypothetical protein
MASDGKEYVRGEFHKISVVIWCAPAVSQTEVLAIVDHVADHCPAGWTCTSERTIEAAEDPEEDVDWNDVCNDQLGHLFGSARKRPPEDS